jgi:hypothetical protein
LSRASARYEARASARTRDLGMLTGRTRLENFSSPSFSYTVRGLARLNISLASALHKHGGGVARDLAERG